MHSSFALSDALSRRKFLHASAALTVSGAVLQSSHAEPDKEPISLVGEVGFTLSCFSVRGPLGPLERIPAVLKKEFGSRVIDLNSNWITSFDRKFLDRARNAAEKAGCVFTNVKMNRRPGNIYDADPVKRQAAMEDRKRLIDAAAHLGAKWARPEGPKLRKDDRLDVSSHQDLAEYAATKSIQILIENGGWMKTRVDGIPRCIAALDSKVAASPDTGNFADFVRYEALRKAYPHAATSDFKFFKLSPDGRHPAYDLKKCFDVGWDAGFRGPWCLEHNTRNLKQLLNELRMVREMLLGWIAQRQVDSNP